MLLIVLIIISAIVFIGAVGYWGSDEGFMGVLFGLLIGAVTALILVGIPLQIIGVNPHTEKNNEPPLPLVALDTGKDAQGQFFLGSGYFESTPTYSYIVQGDGYVYRDMWYDENDARVYLDSEKPSVDYIARCQTNRWLTPWDLCWYSRAEFHVPEGSIKEGYTVAP